MTTIKDPATQKTLSRLHQEAANQSLILLKGLTKGIFRKLKPEDMEEAYIPISSRQGKFIFDLLVKNQSKNIIEFGTSFGISTIYLGAAAKLTGGKVITSEILKSKCEVARQNFTEAGLSDFIEIREGDAMETLKDLPADIDFLLLDGWNDLYLPLLKMLEPKFKSGTLIYTDNATFRSAKPLLDYLRSSNRYDSKPVKDDKGGSDLSRYVG
ncbi:MAG: class I SAM-dependent methyltransferase [Bacteroidota bacterium]